VRERRGTAAGEGEDADEDEEDGADASDGTLVLRAVAKLAGGVALCAVFSDPLVGALGRLSDATGVPPFFVGYTAQSAGRKEAPGPLTSGVLVVAAAWCACCPSVIEIPKAGQLCFRARQSMCHCLGGVLQPHSLHHTLSITTTPGHDTRGMTPVRGVRCGAPGLC